MPGSRSQTPASTSSGPSTEHTSATLNGPAGSSTASPRRSGDTDLTQEEGDSGRRRRRIGGSAGGFLLDSLTARTRSSPTSRRYGSLKGKGKADAGQERVTTPQRYSTHLDGLSNGSPPQTLGSAASPGYGDGASQGSRGTPELPPRPISHSPYSQVRRHDPTQLVNIALQLNQNRQRQASARFQPHSAGAGASGRVVSTSSAPPLGLSPGRGLHRNAVAGERELTPGAVIANGLGTQQQDSQGVEGFTDPDGPAALEFYPSPQTLIRAERARIALELKYHHRRVLQHVPRLPTSKSRRPSTAGTETSDGSTGTGIFGRAYNPLQFTRNRRLRMQKRCPLNAEQDGWNDLERVTAWVNEVAAQRHISISSLNENYPLPLFGLEGSQVLEKSTATPDAGRAKDRNRVVRPRNDWTVTAPDLLADLYWLQEDNNRRLIEDRNGDKIYPPDPIYSNRSANRGRRTALDPKRRSISVPRRSADSGHGSTNGRASMPAVSRDASPEKRLSEDKRVTAKVDERRASRLGPLARRRPRSPSISSSEDDRKEKRRFTRPWSKNFGKNWEGTSMPGRIYLDQSRYNKEPEQAGRASLDVNSARPSLETRRPFSIELHPPAEDQEVVPSRQEALSDIDSTAPNSPIRKVIVPSFAADFDPEAIFGSPPSKRLRSKSKSRHDRHHEVEQMDFAADDPFRADDHNGHSKRELKPLAKAYTTTLSSPSETSFSAEGEHSHQPHLKRHDTERMTLRTPDEGSFRFPKPWKVPKHVAGRVGDLLRRRDYGSDTSETDEDSRQKGLRMSISRATTASTTGRGTLSRSSTLSAVGESPGYRPPEMPSFSPVRREGPTGSPSRLDTSGSISQRLSSKESGDYLSPASIGLKSLSRSLTPQLSRIATAEDKDSSTSSRQTSGQGNGQGRRGATAIDTSGKQWPPPNRTMGSPWPGETGDSSEKSTWTGPELKPTRSDQVTEADILRTEAVLRSLCVKASGIVQTFQCAPATPGPLTSEIHSSYDKTQVPVAKIEEPRVLASHLTKYIDTQTTALNRAAELFTTESVRDMEIQLDGINAIVKDKLTAMVLTAGDDADELGRKMSAGLTREVRDINDGIDQLLRARRRQSRLIRRTAFQLLEWTIMAVMWGVWGVVVSLKMVVGVVRLIIGVVRWLLLL